MSLIRLIDLSGIFWRHWHGSANKEVGAAHGLTLGTVHGLVDGHEEPHGIAVDAGSSFRKEISPAYKANRPEKDAAAMDQLRGVVERLTADGHKILRADGWEADDVIATAAAWAVERGHLVEIVSSDKDLLALVRSTEVRVMRPFEGDLWGPHQVKEKFGVEPELMPQFLALVGDASDNVPGVKGIGAVNAAKLLQRFGSISAILTAADDPASDIPPAVRKALVGGVASIDLSSKLVALRTDVPIDCSILLEPVVIPPTAAPRELGSGKDYGRAEPPEVKGEPVPEHLLEQIRKQKPVPASQALAVVPSWELALEPSTGEEAFKMACTIFDGRLFPAYGNEAAVFSIILTGRSLGLSAMASVRGIQMIKGKPCLSADLIVGLVRNSPLCEYFECVETTDTRARYVTKRRGRPELSYEFTIEEARSRGFTFVGRDGQPAQWTTNPRGMLRAACKRELARLAYEEIVAGVYTPDEMQEAS